MQWLAQRLKSLLLLPVALLILFEEWGWEPLKRAMAWLMRWAPLAWLERVIARLPPYPALLVFFAPTLLLLPIKLAALWLIGWVFYVPMAVLGFPPVVFGVVALIDLLYQFWVHTQQIHKLGWFDRVFCSPSNHRVHHAVNDVYVDRNYGGILVLWDRLFGSFQDELDREPCVYGTRTPLRSFNPLWANVEVYAALAKDSWRARSWGDKWRVWIMPPSWRPADVAASDPRAPFSLLSRMVFESRASNSTVWLAAALFVLGLSVTAVFLWTAHSLAPAVAVGWALVILALLWGVGALLARSHAINVGADGERHAIEPQRLS